MTWSLSSNNTVWAGGVAGGEGDGLTSLPRPIPTPDCYQRLEFFIQVLRVLCPNLTDASFHESHRKDEWNRRKRRKVEWIWWWSRVPRLMLHRFLYDGTTFVLPPDPVQLAPTSLTDRLGGWDGTGATCLSLGLTADNFPNLELIYDYRITELYNYFTSVWFSQDLSSWF